MRNIPIQTLLILFVFYSGTLFAAEFTIEKDEFHQSNIIINGEIKKGDLEKFRSTILSLISAEFINGEITVDINSPGGDVLEAIKLGRLMRSLLISIKVHGNIFRTNEGQWAYELIGKTTSDNRSGYIRLAKGDPIKSEHIKRCHSACVLILAGAIKRNFSDNYDQRTLGVGDMSRKIPTIGIHRPTYDKAYFSKLSASQAKNEYLKLEKVVRDYLNEMGASQRLIDRTFATSSQNIDLVAADEFLKLMPQEEPFFEEWLVSKCGTGSTKDALTPEEFMRFNQRSELLRQFVKKSPVTPSLSEILNYVPPGFTEKESQSLDAKVRLHAGKVSNCKKQAIKKEVIEKMLHALGNG